MSPILNNQVSRLAEIEQELAEKSELLLHYRDQETALIDAGKDDQKSLESIAKAQIQQKALAPLIRRLETERFSLVAACGPVFSGEKAKFRRRVQAKREQVITELTGVLLPFAQDERNASRLAVEIALRGGGIFRRLQRAGAATSSTQADDAAGLVAQVRGFLADVARAEKELDLPKSA
jgi:hypothetical protein